MPNNYYSNISHVRVCAGNHGEREGGGNGKHKTLSAENVSCEEQSEG